MPITFTDTEHRFTVTLDGYDALVPLDTETQRWVQGVTASVVLDATGAPREVTVTGEVVTAASSWTLPDERTRTGEPGSVTLAGERLKQYDTLPGIVSVIVSAAAGRLGSRNDPAALLGYCPTFGHGKAGHVVQPAGKSGGRGTVFLHRPADAPPSWYRANEVKRERGDLIVTTTCGHTVTLGPLQVVDYAY